MGIGAIIAIIWWEGFLEKIGFESGVENSASNGRWQWWWERWVHIVGWEECEEELLGRSWRNEAWSWFQRHSDTYRNEQFVILSEEKRVVEWWWRRKKKNEYSEGAKWRSTEIKVVKSLCLATRLDSVINSINKKYHASSLSQSIKAYNVKSLVPRYASHCL